MKWRWKHMKFEPGPKAQEVIERDHKYTSPSYMRDYPLVVDRAEGCYLWDPDGNRFLDFNAGIAVCTTGHCHPRVVDAVTRQARRLLHYCGTDFYYAPMADLAERLASLAPGTTPKRVFLTNSGTEAVEGAIKLARYVTRRSKLISFVGSFHGRTYGSLSLTASKTVQRKWFGPFLPEVITVPYPYCFRCPFRLDPDHCDLWCISYIEQVVFSHQVDPDEVAAIVVEPVLGEGGYVVPPPQFLPALANLASTHGILLVADEVQTGAGRTGRMWAVEHWGVEPDIICSAKGLASGMPVGAIIAKESVMRWGRGSHGSTFGGNPVSCAAALATLDLLEEGLLDNCNRMGSLLKEKLVELADRHPVVGDVRGLGLMIGVEFVDPVTGKPDAQLRNRLIQEAFHRRVVLLGCGASTIRLAPPLVVGEGEIDAFLEAMAAALDACSQGRG